MSLTVGSLFSGIGGIDLGLERAGMRVVWQAETDSYCCRVLERHWPDVPNLGDVTLIDWTEVPRVDLLAGGYPCQPFSVAGRRQGDRDARHLWPHMRDAVRLLRPRFVLLENVAGHLALGFGRVLGDLAEIGYDAEWDCIPAAAVGAPHRRDRVFIVAYPGGARRRQDPGSAPGDEGTHDGWPSIERTGRQAAIGSEAGHHTGNGRGSSHMADTDQFMHRHGHHGTPTVLQGITGSHEGQGRAISNSDHWAVEPDVGRVAHGIPNRVDRLRSLGNAVVPAVAEHVGRLITEAAT